MIELTVSQRRIIEELHHPLYTVEFIEHWVNRNDNPLVNVVAALQAMGAKGYLEAVKQIEINKQLYSSKWEQ